MARLGGYGGCLSTEPGKAEPSKAKQSKAKQSKAKPSKAKPSKAKPSKAKPGKAGARQSRSEKKPAMAGFFIKTLNEAARAASFI
ncbi:hypothetical protein RBI22_18890 [Alcaligenaceae bacterium C4P045]|nr:hypothetical protein [Alcaligenaceae bacterium C4P045]